MGKGLTTEDMDRQGRVDKAILSLLEEVSPTGYVDWDIENIGIIRDAVENVVVHKMGWLTEDQFYPSVKDEDKPLVVTDKQLEDAIIKVVKELDWDELAQVAGDMLGGVYSWQSYDGETNEATFYFTPTETYGGAFDYLFEKEN